MPAVWAGVGGAAIGALGGLMTNQANKDLTTQQEQWQEQMSDTAMQRRVQDLDAAGLNPLLAISQGGASTPGVNPIAMQNPLQGAGQQISQLPQAQAQYKATMAQADLTSAQAAQTRWQTGDSAVALDDQGNPDWSKMDAGNMGNYNAMNAFLQSRNLKATYDNILKGTAGQDLQNQIAQLDVNAQRQLYNIAIAKATNEAGITANEKLTSDSAAAILGNKTWGPIISGLHAILGNNPIGTAASGASALLHAFKPPTQIIKNFNR